MNPTGAEEELDFWNGFVHSDQFRSWLTPGVPAPELDERIVQLVREEQGRVLDVGSGVVSILWSICPDLLAADLLAAEYQRLFNYAGHGIKPPVAVAGEDLPYYEEFQIVHMRNALDHTQNPFVVWRQLRRAVRLGGILVVAGFENESNFLHGLGMHQWDLSLDSQSLLTMTSRKDGITWVLDPHPFQVLFADVRDLPNGRRWVTWVGRKPSQSQPN